MERDIRRVKTVELQKTARSIRTDLYWSPAIGRNMIHFCC